MSKKILSLVLTLTISKICFAQTYAEHVAGEIIVKFKSNNKAVVAGYKSKLLDSKTYLIKIKNKSNFSETIKEWNSRPNVEFAEPNFIYRAIGVRESSNLTDPMSSHLWGLHNNGTNEPKSNGRNSSPQGIAGADINALKAWKVTKGDSRLKIAVIDTGIDYKHEDLKDNIWVNQAEANGIPGVDDDGNGFVDDIHGYDFSDNDGDPMDGNGHGTHCAGTIAAVHDNGLGIKGVMGDAQIVAVKFLNDDGAGDTASAIEAIKYATSLGVDIMNNSWGGGGESQALKNAIEEARDAGIIFTAAAGNSATNNNSLPQFPANYNLENVISVAAHNYADTLASFSCYGNKTVHVAAPGRNILSTVPGNKYAVYSGTSMATPHVTGVVGLYISHKGRQDVGSLRTMLMDTSVYKKSYGRKIISAGRVDAYNFLNEIKTSRPIPPSENSWISKSVDLFETSHPYAPQTLLRKKFVVPGAQNVRVVVRNYGIEKNYDSLRFLDASGAEIDRVDGSGTNFVSEYVDGDTIEVFFKADASVQDYGIEINEIQFVRK